MILCAFLFNFLNFLSSSFFFNFNWRLITLQYLGGFCHTLTWISHRCTCIPYPELLSHLPPHPIPLGHPSAPALSTLSHASNLDWRSVLHMIIYVSMPFSQIIPPSPSSPSHPFGSSQCTSPEYPVSCIQPGLAICFTYEYICFNAILSNHPTLAFSHRV